MRSGYRTLSARRRRKVSTTVEATIHEVSDEDVIRLWAGASNLEEFHQVKELAVDITANGYRGIYDLNITLLDKDFSGFDTQPFDLFL